MRRVENDSKRSGHPRAPRAFTLVELLVVIGIIAVLVSILIPVVGRARRSGRNVSCLANLRSLQSALISYVATNRHSIDYAPISLTNANAATNVRRDTWEGELQPYYGNADKVRICPEAVEAAEKPIGSATLAHGSTKPPTAAMKLINDTWSYGSYGINGFLYYQTPGAANPGGKNHVNLAGKPRALTGSKTSPHWTAEWCHKPSSTPLAPTCPSTLAPPAPFPHSATATTSTPGPPLPAPRTTTLPPPPVGIPCSPVTRRRRSVTPSADSASTAMAAVSLEPPTSFSSTVHAASVPLKDLWQLRWNKDFFPIPNIAFP